MKKIVQLVVFTFDNHPRLMALCADGTIWHRLNDAWILGIPDLF